MRTTKALFMLAALFACGHALAQTGTSGCQSASPNSQNYRTCLSVTNLHPRIGGDKSTILTYIEQPPGFSQPTTFTILDGTTPILTGLATSNHPGQPNSVLFELSFTSLGTVALSSDPALAGYPNSQTILIQVEKYAPEYSMSATPAQARIGDSIQLKTTTRFYRPDGGQLEFYVTLPGGNIVNATKFAQKAVTVAGPGTVDDNDQRNFTFSAPNDAPGEYIFFARYSGDTLNGANGSNYLRVRVGPSATTTSLTQSDVTSVQGKPVTLTATVVSAPKAVAAATGNVEFYDGTLLLDAVPLVSGTAVLANTTKLRAVGSRALTARYVGDPWNTASTSSAVTHETRSDPALLVPILEILMD